jgi:hypothetical protein
MVMADQVVAAQAATDLLQAAKEAFGRKHLQVTVTLVQTISGTVLLYKELLLVTTMTKYPWKVMDTEVV